jgi:hypothetical protein
VTPPPSKPPKGIAWRYTFKYVALFSVAIVLFPLVLAGTLAVSLGKFISYVRPDRLLGLAGSLLSGTVYAIAGAGIIVRRGYRNLFDINYSKRSAVDKTAQLTIHLPYDEAFDRCLYALPSTGTCYILLADREQGIIEAARIPQPYWKSLMGSYGERISIRLGSNRRAITAVEVTSRAPLSIMKFDMGQNERNVSNISVFLRGSAA